MNKSLAVQQTEVGDGLALGILVRGTESITANKMKVEFAFEHVWRDWPQARHYPQIRADLARNDIYHQIIGRSAGRRFGRTAWQSNGGLLYPQLVSGNLTVDDELEMLAESSGVSEDAWRQLAGAFLGDINRARRSDSEQS